MKQKITHPLYKDYPNQPYISPDRDLDLWEKHPEKFPYSKVTKFNMTELEDSLFPGDIILLWRVGLGNYNTESHITNYFEYRYGINHDDSLKKLMDKSLIIKLNAKASLNQLNIPELKNILKALHLPLIGNKSELMIHIQRNVSEHDLENMFSVRTFEITDKGQALLKKYDDIIQKHGPKKL